MSSRPSRVGDHFSRSAKSRNCIFSPEIEHAFAILRTKSFSAALLLLLSSAPIIVVVLRCARSDQPCRVLPPRRLLNRDIRIRNPPTSAVDKILTNPSTRSALERAKADMAAAAAKVWLHSRLIVVISLLLCGMMCSSSPRSKAACAGWSPFMPLQPVASKANHAWCRASAG